MPEGLQQVLRNLDAWALRRRAANLALAQNWAGRLERYMKQKAPWRDRTGNARNGLWGAAGVEGGDVFIRIGHTVHYGIYLELAHDGKYAILEPTRRRFQADIFKSFEELWKE